MRIVIGMIGILLVGILTTGLGYYVNEINSVEVAKNISAETLNFLGEM